jgi:hypothetical protein
MLAIAVLAIGICGWLWYERLEPAYRFSSPPFPKTSSNTTKQAETPTPALMLEGGIAPVIASINWADPKNPAAIALDYPNFLFDSQEGLQVWNLETLEMTPLIHPLGKVQLLDFARVRTQYSISTAPGTMFAVKSPESSVTLFWMPDNQANTQPIPSGDGRRKVEKQLKLPSGFYPDASLGLSNGSMLLCSSVSKKAIVAGIRNNELSLLTSANDSGLYHALQEKGVFGEVEGVGIMQTPNSELAYKPPLVFDINTCRWQAKNLPEHMAQGLELLILPDSRLGISAASWLDPTTHELQTLRTPLVWDRTSRQWTQRKASDVPGLTPQHTTLPLMEEWYYAASPREGKFEFLWGGNDRWCESKQSLPVTEDLKLLPIGNDGVLALLIDSEAPGRVVRLYPRNPFGPAYTNNDEHTKGDANPSVSGQGSAGRSRFPYSLSDFLSIQLNDGSAVILDGEKLKRTFMISPVTDDVTQLQDLPQPLQRPSGVQLNDGSIVVFGGLSSVCRVTDLAQCTQSILPGYRWINDEKRWQTLPSLMVPFAFGTPFDGGNSGITTAYDRGDFTVKNGMHLYYLTQNRLSNIWVEKPTPSFLFRWKPGNDPEKLASTRLSRNELSLIELNDGRLVAVGGVAEVEPQSPACQACMQKRRLEVERITHDLTNRRITHSAEDEEGETMEPEQMVPQCEACSSIQLGDYYTYARSCEIYDEKSNRWYYGPFSVNPGGRAVKLANGKIFKFGLNGYNATDADYVAEVADATLKKWEATPPFPISKPDALVSQIVAIGNQVLIVLERPSDRYVVWDDVSGNWQIHALPKHSDWGFNHIPAHVSAIDNNQLLLIFNDGFEYISWPIQE